MTIGFQINKALNIGVVTERKKKKSTKAFMQVYMWTLSVEKGAKVTHAIASELVSLNRDKNLVLHQILHCSATGGLPVSA